MRRSRSNPSDEGAVCQAAADLIRSELLPSRSLVLHPRQWAAIESALGPRRRARRVARWGWRLAVPTLAAAAGVLWAIFGAGGPRLDYSTEGCQIATDARTGAGMVTTAAGEHGRIVFSDGSTIALDGGTRGRLVLPDRSSSAELVLERGAAELSVIHRADTRWSVEAGPFRIEVKGTRFHVSWSPPQRHFRLDLRRGELTVSGRPLATPLTLRSGEELEVIDGQVIVAGSAQTHEQPKSEPPPTRPTGASTREESNEPAVQSVGRVALAAQGATAAGEESSAGAGTETGTRKDSPMKDQDEPGRISRAARTVGVAAALGALGLARPSSVDAAAPSPPGSPVAIGSHGKLEGPMTGYAWVAAGAESTIDTPSPCDARGCFKDTPGPLCTRGTIPALRCTSPGGGTGSTNDPSICNWETNWGAMIGMNTTSGGGPWLSAAPVSLSLAYHARDERAQIDRGRYRMNVHVAGDPESKVYCIDTYLSGQVVDASMLKTECWTGSGETLGSFQQVDKVGLLLPSMEAPTPFDYCITAIAVNGTALFGPDAAAEGSRHIAIGGNGKLGGEMTGYAWVAGGGGTTFRTPQPCNQSGCFRNTQGRLCAAGAIAALSCSEPAAGPPTCDWQTNWGAMIGLNANLIHGAWGATAPTTVALTFSGPVAGYRLVAHVAGAADSELFCLEGYSSGQPVAATMLKSRCWSGAGETLSSFQQVDQIGLLLVAATDPVPFDLCLSDVVVR